MEQSLLVKGKLKMRIAKFKKSFIRDSWGNLTNCFWNQMAKDDIVKLEEEIKAMENEMEIETIDKGKYPVIVVPPNGKPDWYLGAYSLVFVYSKNNGNFLLKGYRGDVLEYMKKHYTHYFYYVSMWSSHGVRGHWQFWKDDVSIYSPNKPDKDWKYKVTNRSWRNRDKNIETIEYSFKRLPKYWIPEFNKL